MAKNEKEQGQGRAPIPAGDENVVCDIGVRINPYSYLQPFTEGRKLEIRASGTTDVNEAEGIFLQSASKYQESAGVSLMECGNVYRLMAKKKIVVDGISTDQLEKEYDWVRKNYRMAEEKYDQALRVCPDLQPRVSLHLGEVYFQLGKLKAQQDQDSSSIQDSDEIIDLFDKAAMNWKNHVDNQDVASKAEQVKINLSWGHLCFQKSEVEFMCGRGNWNKNLDEAIESFKLAGVHNISSLVNGHCSKTPSLKVSTIEESPGPGKGNAFKALEDISE